MDTRALAEMAGGVLVAALRSEHSAIASGEITALFARWQTALPDGLIVQSRQPAGTPGEERALAGRWQRLCDELLSAHPEAERELFAFIERVRQRGLAIARPTPPPAPPAGLGPEVPYGQVPSAYRLGPPPSPPPGAAPGAAQPAPGGRGKQSDKSKERATPLLDRGSGDAVSRAIRSAVRPGVLAFNPPAEMTQGRSERVEVAVARSAELVDSLVSGLRGRGEVRVEDVPTSAFMSAELRGDSFAITALSPAEQIVAPTARWEFDVIARRAGVQTLTLCVSLRFAETGPLAVPGSRIAVPVVERQIRIRVSVGYGARTFVAQNWQWVVGTTVAVGAAVAAFLAVFH